MLMLAFANLSFADGDGKVNHIAANMLLMADALSGYTEFSDKPLLTP